MAKSKTVRPGRIPLTLQITAMAIVCLGLGLAGVVLAMLVIQNGRTEMQVQARVSDTMRLAVTMLQVNMPSMKVATGEAGLESISMRAMPRLRTHEMVDQIAGAAGEDVSLYAVDPDTAVFGKLSTSVLPEGEVAQAKGPQTAAESAALAADPAKVAAAMAAAVPRDATPLDPAGDVFKALVAGQPIRATEMTPDGKRATAYFPVLSANGQTVGAIAVGVDSSRIEAAVGKDMLTLLAVCGAMMVLLGTAVILGARKIFSPLPMLTKAMKRIADGDLESSVPYVNYRNEIGTMAQSMEVFRDNARQVGIMGEAQILAENRRHADRAAMMQILQRAFGTVVDAAVAGDFSNRIEDQFEDAELNALANGVNNLVETVDAGLTATGQVLAALAQADLSQRIDGQFAGAFATLKASTNGVADNLAGIVVDLKDTSASLKTASSEILSGANDLSERTTRQAATIEETSATMEQLSATVLANSRKAKDASANAEQVSHLAEESGSVMSRANEAMERITASSSKISNIIGLIDDIAFQTNLLALNASVEAARAGDAGKGFAVVAVEVRRLAQSAASASADVKALIEQSANEVGSGTRLVSEASGKLSTMLASIRQNHQALETIARASQEQASSIDEVNMAVRQMDEMTQHNAALVEQMNAAIEQSERQATHLDTIVDVFVIDTPVTFRDTDRRAA